MTFDAPAVAPECGCLGPAVADRATDPRDEATDPVRHVVVGPRGGQGTTTVATALAVLSSHQADTTLVAHDRDAVCGIAGIGPDSPDGRVALAPGLTLADTPGTTAVTVVDAGRLADLDCDTDEMQRPASGERRWLVVRGPCYLSLRAAVAHRWSAHGVILVHEARRALRARDVADVLGIPVVAEVPQDHRVARSIDAGTFLATVARHAALADLTTLVAPGLDATYFEVTR